jgi:hypothetical protein
MAPAHISMITSRKILKQLHVADEGRSRIAAFEQIVAQDSVLRKSSAYGALESIHIVDSFADE